MTYDVGAWAIHRWPHPDEFLARFLLEQIAAGAFGQKRGMLSVDPAARFVVWEDGSFRTPDGRDIGDWLDNGTMPLGTGGDGPFNDHIPDPRVYAVPYCETCKKEGEKPRWCLVDLIAYEYGIMKDWRIRNLLRYVHANDVHGTSADFDLARMVAMVQRMNPDLDPEALYQQWVRPVFDAHFRDQTAFFACRELAKACVVTVPSILGEGPISCAVVDGPGAGNERMCDWVRSTFGGQHALVIRKDPGQGQMQILPRRGVPVDMRPTVAVLRYLEWKADPSAYGPKPSYDELAVDANCPTSPLWFFQEQSGTILNGSRTHPGVTPTRIPLAIIVAVVTRLAVPRAAEIASQWDTIDTLIGEATAGFSLPLPKGRGATPQTSDADAVRDMAASFRSGGQRQRQELRSRGTTAPQPDSVH